MLCGAGGRGSAALFGAVVVVLAGFVVVMPAVGVGVARVGVGYHGKGEEKRN